MKAGTLRQANKLLEKLINDFYLYDIKMPISLYLFMEMLYSNSCYHVDLKE